MGSAYHKLVDNVRKAVEISKSKAPDLDIDGQVKFACPEFAGKTAELEGHLHGAGQGLELPAIEGNHFIELGMVFQEIDVLGIEQPTDPGLRIAPAQPIEQRQGMDDVAQRTGLDDQNAAKVVCVEVQFCCVSPYESPREALSLLFRL